MISLSDTLKQMARECADSMSLVDNSEGDRDRFEEALKALYKVAKLQLEQDATIAYNYGGVTRTGREIAAAIRATPETPT